MKNKKFVRIGVLTLILVVLCILYLHSGSRAEEIGIDADKEYRVSYVVDGDTIKVVFDREEITVRLLGINTPETLDPRKPPECFGKEASSRTKALLLHRKVKLRTSPNRELTDKYGRYLLYVYRDDGLFINEYLVKNGFAREYTYGKPYSMQKIFREFENEAKSSSIGLWGICV